MIDINYKGIDGYSTYGVIVRSVRRLLPGLRKKELTMPGKHGTYDFGDNDSENFVISLDLSFKGASMNDMRLKAREIAAWLRGSSYEPLIFSDEPDKYYLAKIYDEAQLQNFVRVGQGQIQFECQPMTDYIADTGDDITLDSLIPLDAEIELNPADSFIFYVTSPTTVEFDNWGTAETGVRSQIKSKFVIQITGGFTTLSITMNGRTISYNEAISGSTVTIDNVGATVKRDGANKIGVCSGDLISFLEVVPGTNTATITGTGLNCTVLFDFRPQYI